jgi:hypothetical protein
MFYSNKEFFKANYKDGYINLNENPYVRGIMQNSFINAANRIDTIVNSFVNKNIDIVDDNIFDAKIGLLYALQVAFACGYNAYAQKMKRNDFLVVVDAKPIDNQ